MSNRDLAVAQPGGVSTIPLAGPGGPGQADVQDVRTRGDRDPAYLCAAQVRLRPLGTSREVDAPQDG